MLRATFETLAFEAIRPIVAMYEEKIRLAEQEEMNGSSSTAQSEEGD